MSRQCYLKCLEGSHAPIELPHREEIILGRSKITKIKDQSCSRQQLSLTADCDTCFVEVKQLGINPSGLDGFALAKCGVYRLGHGSRIEVLLNSYIHVIEFNPVPEDYIREQRGSKRKLEGKPKERLSDKRKQEDEEPSPKKKKILKMDSPDKDTKVKEAAENIWEDIDRGELYIFTSKGVKSSRKIAAFDMDGTLIKTKSGKVHPVDINDWQVLLPQIPEKLKQLNVEGYKIVILSNQAPIGNGRVKIEDFKKKIEGLVEKLAVPVQVYIATGKGIFRKPAIGMWKILSEQKNDGLKIEVDNSFYCGDAAGRVANWAPGKKKDHSMADKLMAENLGLKFYTPEQFFLGHSISNVKMSKPEFVPSDVKSEPFDDNLISKEKEILVLVGFPGSGKSFIGKQIEKKSNNQYVSVCRDILGTWQKCAMKAKELLKKGKSVIVDSTNPDAESRARWTSLAKEMHVDCRCAKLLVSMAHARHNNKFRELMKTNHLQVNDIVYHTYKNKYTEPTVTEGFKEVIEVKFSPSFADAELEKLYRMHLLEK